ncbi:hypothetical protein BGZ63DRAFT_467292 [Mariannaea sp. PMI_226]|nr:hypothetical protein BGZ63DRAFT_467292 [Mariannaea sp. PMI_226]
MSSRRAGQHSTYFDWDQSSHHLQSENESWIQKILEQGRSETPLGLFLETPLHSPKIRSHCWDEFYAIELPKALEQLQSGMFGGPMASRIWLYDTNGLQARTYNGVVSAQKAHKTLQLKRFGEKNEPDARIRRLHISNPTPESMSVVIYDAKKSDLCVLRPLFWNHIRGQKNAPLFSFKFENGGLTFAITFQIPSFVLYSTDADKSPPEDSRMKTDNTPWRNSMDISFLSKDDSNIYTLHESQHSFAVYGHGKSVWKSLYLHDDYFHEKISDNEDTIEYYDDDEADSEECSEECAEEQEWDPSLLGNLEAKTVSQDPCEFFLAVLNERCEQWHHEWIQIHIKVQEKISEYTHSASTAAITLPESQNSAREALRQIEIDREWLRRTLGLLGLLNRTLSGITKAWDNFRNKIDEFSSAKRLFFLQNNIDDKVNSMIGIQEGFVNLEAQCEQFRKDLELAIGVRSGPVMASQSLNITFMQAVTPVVVSAALIQAQIIPYGSQLVLFLLLSGGLFALNWHIEPSLNPIPESWRTGIRNLLSNLKYGNGWGQSPRQSEGARWEIELDRRMALERIGDEEERVGNTHVVGSMGNSS